MEQDAERLRGIVHGAAQDQVAIILRDARASNVAVNDALVEAQEMGAERTSAICSYARRPSQIPLTIVAGEILGTKNSVGLQEITGNFSYAYKAPPSLVTLMKAINAGETTTPIAALAPVLRKELENGRLMVDARKALILSLKHLHTFFNRVKRQGQAWEDKGNKAEGESLVRIVFANLLFLLVRKKLKEIHNIEARRLLALLRQTAREAEGNSEIEAQNRNGARITIKPLVVFDDFLLNVLNQILMSWPHLAIHYHLNNGVLGTKTTRPTMPEILGSLEKAVEFLEGPLAAEMAEIWNILDETPARLSPEAAAAIREAGAGGPAPQPAAATRPITGLFNREEKEEEEKLQSMFGSMFQSFASAAGAGASALVSTITDAFKSLRQPKRPRNTQLNEPMNWVPTGRELLADYDVRDLNGVNPMEGAATSTVDLEAIAAAAQAQAPNLGALARAVEGSESNANLGNMNANAVAARNAQRAAAQAARQAAEEASEEWRRKKGGARKTRNRRNKKRKTTRRNRNRK
jgi:hypothetical protein